MGETALAADGRLSYYLPDVLGAQRSQYADRHTLVVGAGFSAITVIAALLKVCVDRKACDEFIFELGQHAALSCRGNDRNWSKTLYWSSAYLRSCSLGSLAFLRSCGVCTPPHSTLPPGGARVQRVRKRPAGVPGTAWHLTGCRSRGSSTYVLTYVCGAARSCGRRLRPRG